MINLQYSVAFISSRCALHRLRRSIRFPSIFGFLMILCRKTQRTNAKSGRPKVADWKVAMWKKCTGRLVSKWERTGRNGPILQTHTRVSYSSIDKDYISWLDGPLAPSTVNHWLKRHHAAGQSNCMDTGGGVQTRNESEWQNMFWHYCAAYNYSNNRKNGIPKDRPCDIIL